MLQETLSFTSILEIPTLSSGATKALLGLLSFRNRTTGRCNPGIVSLRRRLGGAPESTVRRWLRELRLAGMVKATRHRGSNSYDFHIEDFHSVDKPVIPLKSERSTPLKSERSTPLKSERSQPAHPYMNQTAIEPTQRNADADVKATGSVEAGGKPAAAAASSPSQESLNSERRATPPAAEKVAASQPGASSFPASNEEPECVVETAIVKPKPQVDIPPLAVAVADKLIDVHPQPGLPNRVAPLIETILRNAADPLATAERIWENHRVWRDYWARLEAGRFIPQLWRWLDSGEWQKPPVIRKPAEKETYVERMRRQFREA